MGPVTATVTIDAPREEVFARLRDAADRPGFTDHFLSSYSLLSITGGHEGSGARFHIDSPVHGIWADSVITAIEEPHRIDEHGHWGRGNRIPTSTIWEMMEAGDGMTRITVTFWTEPEVIEDRLKERFFPTGWYRRQWRKALRRLKDQVESGEQAPAPVSVAGGNPYRTGVA
ncbi:MAG: SRPBCC family protein [Solirubrobacterales bacterium]